MGTWRDGDAGAALYALCVPYSVKIDWATATVKPQGSGSLELRVQFGPEPGDSHWRNAFEELKDRTSTDGRLPPDSWVNSLQGDRISVGLAPGTSEDSLRTALDELVEAANERAEEIRMESDERKRAEADSAEALQRAADEATERFRSQG